MWNNYLIFLGALWHCKMYFKKKKKIEKNVWKEFGLYCDPLWKRGFNTCIVRRLTCWLTLGYGEKQVLNFRRKVFHCFLSLAYFMFVFKDKIDSFKTHWHWTDKRKPLFYLCCNTCFRQSALSRSLQMNFVTAFHILLWWWANESR